MPFCFTWQANDLRADSGRPNYKPRRMSCVGSRGRVRIGTLSLAGWSLLRKRQNLFSGSVHPTPPSSREESRISGASRQC